MLISKCLSFKKGSIGVLCVLVSKKILTLGAKGDPPPRPKALQLQRMIRYAATLFVQVRPDIQIILSMKRHEKSH